MPEPALPTPDADAPDACDASSPSASEPRRQPAPPARDQASASARTGRRVAASLALAAMLLTIPGCIVGVLLPEVIQPQYRISQHKKQPILILVDDPGPHFGDLTAANLIADEAAIWLDRKGVAKNIIPIERVNELMLRLGGTWNTDPLGGMPVDRIGRELGAEIVIHVTIASMRLDSQPGVVSPRAEAWVRVLDVPARRRLFPPSDPGQTAGDLAPQPRGVRVETRLVQRHFVGDDDGVRDVLTRELALTLGRDIARVFHRWSPRQRGEPLGPYAE